MVDGRTEPWVTSTSSVLEWEKEAGIVHSGVHPGEEVIRERVDHLFESQHETRSIKSDDDMRPRLPVLFLVLPSRAPEWQVARLFGVKGPPKSFYLAQYIPSESEAPDPGQ